MIFFFIVHSSASSGAFIVFLLRFISLSFVCVFTLLTGASFLIRQPVERWLWFAQGAGRRTEKEEGGVEEEV